MTQARLCLSLLHVEKRGRWKWASWKGEGQDEACYSFSPRGVGTTRRQGESAHCPHMPHTYVHVRQKAVSSTAQPNMLQHFPKKSENECKLRLFFPPLLHCLTLFLGGGVSFCTHRAGGSRKVNKKYESNQVKVEINNIVHICVSMKLNDKTRGNVRVDRNNKQCIFNA